MEGEEGNMGRRSWGRTRRRRHCRGGGLAGVAQSSSTVHGFQNQKHRGDAGKKANSTMPPARSRKGCTALAMTGGGRGSPEFAKTALEAMIEEDKGMGRKQGRRRPHRAESTRRRRLGYDGRRGGVDGSSGESLPCGGAVPRVEMEWGGQQGEAVEDAALF
jgi:hypothetical protein